MPILVIAVLLIQARVAAAHEFADGHVERSMAIVLRDRTAVVEYRIGLNNETLKQLTADAHSKTKPDKPRKKDDFSGEQALPQPPKPTQPKPTQPKPTQPKPTSNLSSLSQVDRTSHNLTKPTVSQPDLDGKPEATPQDRDHEWLAPKLQQQFQAKLLKQVPQGLQFRCNQETLTPLNITLGHAPRHPFQFSVRFEFVLPSASAANARTPPQYQLEITDENFTQQRGAIRRAFTPKGSTIILRSNAAATLTRAKREELPLAGPLAAIKIQLAIPSTRPRPPTQ